MAEDKAFLDSYDQMEVELADGTVIRAEPLSVRQFARFWRLHKRAAQGDGEAMLEVLDTFPEAIGRPDLGDSFTPAELFAMLPVFFTLARPARLPKMETDEPTAETPETETDASGRPHPAISTSTT